MTDSDQLLRTKIVATIGPATHAPEQIAALLAAGMNVARVNCAHSRGEALASLLDALRERAARAPQPFAILADLGGPKLRVRRLAGGAVHLARGQPLVLTTADILGNTERVAVTDPTLPHEVRPGDPIYLNDGLITLVVTGTTDTDVQTEVETGGELRDLQGVSAPTASAGLAALTATDEAALDILAAHNADYVGMSFVRSAGDLAELRQALVARQLAVPIVAKIERAQALGNLDAIVGAADAVMVARGDLGVECPVEQVPIWQKRIIERCTALGVPVITATQMLESMVVSPRPTRAEASDVANAVLDGTDAVMLSAETAMGRHPVEAVRTMRRIAAAAEAFAAAEGPPPPSRSRAVAESAAEAIGQSACLAAAAIGAQAIVCLTQSGATARQVARRRPTAPILGATPRPDTARRLALVWGVQPVLVEVFGPDFDAACTRIVAGLRQRGRLVAGRPVVLTAGLPFSTRGATNTVRIEQL